MTLVWVLVPVLARPHRAAELHRSIIGSQGTVRLQPVFLCSPQDPAEIHACRVTGATVEIVTWPPGPGDYARKINHGHRLACEAGADWIFMGADDLCFCPGWADHAVAEGERTGAMVVGTNDLTNPLVIRGQHATHSLIRCGYAGTWDDDGILHEGYDHQYVDNELVQVARQRGVWAFSRHAMVEHLHPLFGKGRLDSTYGKALRHGAADMARYQERQRLFC